MKNNKEETAHNNGAEVLNGVAFKFVRKNAYQRMIFG